jgi:hypothetical protein
MWISGNQRWKQILPGTPPRPRRAPLGSSRAYENRRRLPTTCRKRTQTSRRNDRRARLRAENPSQRLTIGHWHHWPMLETRERHARQLRATASARRPCASTFCWKEAANRNQSASWRGGSKSRAAGCSALQLRFYKRKISSSSFLYTNFFFFFFFHFEFQKEKRQLQIGNSEFRAYGTKAGKSEGQALSRSKYLREREKNLARARVWIDCCDIALFLRARARSSNVYAGGGMLGVCARCRLHRVGQSQTYSVRSQTNEPSTCDTRCRCAPRGTRKTQTNNTRQEIHFLRAVAHLDSSNNTAVLRVDAAQIQFPAALARLHCISDVHITRCMNRAVYHHLSFASSGYHDHLAHHLKGSQSGNLEQQR